MSDNTAVSVAFGKCASNAVVGLAVHETRTGIILLVDDRAYKVKKSPPSAALPPDPSARMGAIAVKGLAYDVFSRPLNTGALKVLHT
jgi:hypothetical protein